MSWYYAVDGRQMGPIDEAAFRDLVGQGIVKPETLVWREGMANWLPYAHVSAPPVSPSMPPAPMPMAGAGSSPQPDTGAPAASGPETIRYCSQCGRGYPASQLQMVGAATICASCRPAYMGGMAASGAYSGPGAVPYGGVPGGMPYGAPGGFPAARRYGGFWIRFLARIIDGIIVGIANVIVRIPLMLAVGLNDFSNPNPGNLGAFFATLGLSSLIGLGFGIAYEAYFLSTRGATPGKIALGLEVIRPTGEFITPARAVGRYFAYILSGLTLCIGFIIAGFDSEKRALHDHLCDTRVVYKS